MQKPPGKHFHLPASLSMRKMYRSLSLLPVCLSAATSDFLCCLLDKWALLLEEHPSPQRAYQSSTAAATIPSTDGLSAASWPLSTQTWDILGSKIKNKKKQVCKKKCIDLPLHLKLRAPHLVLSWVRLFLTSWTISHQAPLSLGFSRQEHKSGLPFPFLGDLPDPGIESASLASSALALGHLGSQ